MIHMTLKHLRIFVTVYQEMNITKAADLLHMTQPAVSRSIQELENYYGIRLFERINRRLYRTKESEEIYVRALHIVNSFHDMELEIKNWDEFGIFRIGASITLGNFILPVMIRQLQNLYPNLRVQAAVSKSNTIYELLLDDKIDIAIVEGDIPDEHIHKEVILEDHLKLILPHEHPLCSKPEIYMEDLVQYPILMRDKGSAGRDFLINTDTVAALDRKQMIGRRNHVRNIGAHDHQIVMIMRPGGRNRAVFLNSSGRERQRDLSALAITLDAGHQRQPAVLPLNNAVFHRQLRSRQPRKCRPRINFDDLRSHRLRRQGNPDE